MSDTRDPNPDASETAMEQILVKHLATNPLDAEALNRMRAAVQDAWEATSRPTAPPGTRLSVRHWVSWAGIALAACVLAAVIGLFVVGQPADEREMIGSLARAPDGTIEVDERFFRHRTLAVGDAVRVGDNFTARGAALILLTQGGTLRVAEGSAVGVATASELQLKRGTIYVDKPAGLPNAGRLRVATRVGLVEHVGTEFEVFSDDQIVRIRVREGQVRFSGAIGVQLAPAGTELVATSDGQVTRQPVPTYGRDWQWTVALAPEFAVEGRSLDDYLRWISRELGRTVVFADARARESAQRTILHGPVRSPATLDALAEILSSTSLTYELGDGVIRVHSTQ
jgi:ferric-dicitrate binding protein FerR (iron transport regulator)